MCLTSKDIEDAADSIAEADVLLLQLETPIDASQSAIEIAKANDTIVILDPAPARPLPPNLLAQVDILTPNATEATVLSGHAVTTPEEGIAAGQGITNTDSERWTICSRANTWRTRRPAMHTNANHTHPRNSC